MHKLRDLIRNVVFKRTNADSELMRSAGITKIKLSLHERGFTDEEVSPGRHRHSFTRSECSICPGCRARRASRSHCRASSCRSRTQVCLDRRLSPLGWSSLCLGPRILGRTAACRRSLGAWTLGGSLRRMGMDRGPLALVPAPCKHRRRARPADIAAARLRSGS